ncbi:spore germination protein [Desulfotomaculum defluvii]
MFNLWSKKLRFKKLKSRKITKNLNANSVEKETFTINLEGNLLLLQSLLGESSDVLIRRFNIGNSPHRVAIVYLEEMVDVKVINESIIKPLMDNQRLDSNTLGAKNSLDFLERLLLPVGNVEKTESINQVLDSVLFGYTILFLDGCSQCLLISSKGWKSRAIQEPNTEVVVRGPHEGFTESLSTNTAQLRRKIRNPQLIFETMKIGERTKSLVRIVYMKGLVKSDLVEEVKKRLNAIDTDAILESGYIEQYIEDEPYSFFPTVGSSERPDVIAANILEGRIAILVDGTPVVLTIPTLFVENFQSAEDYYSRPYYASLVRLLRFLGFFITTTAPGVYVALTTFHQELIPTPLLITMAAAREGTPFPALLEALLMIITFEILREAGVRLPRPVGPAISIVGALVIGEAAVSAGIVGAPIVIVIAITAISSFIVPALGDVAVLLRIIVTIFAGFIGLVGIVVVLMQVIIHLASLRSFGMPYLSPVSPLHLQGLKDSFVRFPLWSLSTRPKSLQSQDTKRQQSKLMPEPPSEKQR